jgi:hypothetical protein
MQNERALTLRQIDRARGDLYAISDEIEVVKARLAESQRAELPGKVAQPPYPGQEGISVILDNLRYDFYDLADFRVIGTTTFPGAGFVSPSRIADMICYPWASSWAIRKIEIDEFPNVKRWLEEIGERPAVKKAMAMGPEFREDPASISAEEQARRRKLVADQRAQPIPSVDSCCVVHLLDPGTTIRLESQPSSCWFHRPGFGKLAGVPDNPLYLVDSDPI